MILVTGGSGSGKSEYAENLAVDIAKKRLNQDSLSIKADNDAEKIREDDTRSLLYVATMANAGKEAKRRIARHRKLRSGKGFETLESMFLEEDIEYFRNRVVLLEDLSNLLSNYMYMKGNQYISQETDIKEGKGTEDISEKIEGNKNWVDIISNKLIAINDVCRELIIVTNEVFSDGIAYDSSVMDFIKNLAILNGLLAKQSHQFTEVVYGIPVMIKGGRKNVLY